MLWIKQYGKIYSLNLSSVSYHYLFKNLRINWKFVSYFSSSTTNFFLAKISSQGQFPKFLLQICCCFSLLLRFTKLAQKIWKIVKIFVLRKFSKNFVLRKFGQNFEWKFWLKTILQTLRFKIIFQTFCHRIFFLIVLKQFFQKLRSKKISQNCCL